ncbi:MAG: hypothetical protein QG555_1261, partial [Thermodesulfobacteriota bacterium]|nr:hypothetical protein [Thermodesulfobacteriota bacterium]
RYYYNIYVKKFFNNLLKLSENVTAGPF